MIEFYDNDMSVCAQKVRLVLAEKKLPYERHHLNLRAGDQFRGEYLKLNPGGVVPTIVDDGKVVIESTVIIDYLDNAYPEPALKPADPHERAAMLRWMIRPDAGLHRACGRTSFSIAFRHQLAHLGEKELAAFIARIPDESRRAAIRETLEQGLDAPGVDTAIRSCRDAVAAMRVALQETPWLAGSAYSLADATMTPYVLRLEHLGLSFIWDEMPDVADWFARVRARDNYAAIEDHLDPKYLALFESVPAEVHDRARQIIRG